MGNHSSNGSCLRYLSSPIPPFRCLWYVESLRSDYWWVCSSILSVGADSSAAGIPNCWYLSAYAIQQVGHVLRHTRCACAVLRSRFLSRIEKVRWIPFGNTNRSRRCKKWYADLFTVRRDEVWIYCQAPPAFRLSWAATHVLMSYSSTGCPHWRGCCANVLWLSVREQLVASATSWLPDHLTKSSAVILERSGVLSSHLRYSAINIAVLRSISVFSVAFSLPYRQVVHHERINSDWEWSGSIAPIVCYMAIALNGILAARDFDDFGVFPPWHGTDNVFPFGVIPLISSHRARPSPVFFFDFKRLAAARTPRHNH